MARGKSTQSGVSGDPSRREQMDLILSYRRGFQAVHVTATGVQLGLFEKLAAQPKGLTYRELAQVAGYHAPYVRVWCSTAYHFRLLEAEPEGRYRLAPHLDSLLGDRTHPDSMVSMMTSALTEQGPRMARYSDYMKGGEVASHAEAYGRNSNRLDPPRSQGALHRRVWIEDVVPKVARLGYTLKNGGRLLDIGCGPGVVLVELAQLYPQASFVGIDVVELGGLNTARRLIDERGLQALVQVIGMKADEIAFQEEFDGILMASVLHEILPVEFREKVFRACFRALKQPGVFLVRDSPYPDSLEGLRDARFNAGVYTQYQEMAWGTVQPTQQDRHDLFTQAGFDPVEHHYIDGLPQGTAYLDVGYKL